MLDLLNMNRRNLMLGAGAAAIVAVIPVAAIAAQPVKSWVILTGKGLAHVPIDKITQSGGRYFIHFTDRVEIEGV